MTRQKPRRATTHFSSASRARNIFLLLSISLLSARCTFAQKASADEYEIRAAMLFNLTRFIDWPAWKLDATHPEFDVCLLGANPIGTSIDALMQGKTVQNKPVVVKHLTSIDNATACHILYESAGARKGVAHASGELEKSAVLTISEKANSDNPAQVMGLPTSDDHVHIEVNLGAAQRSGLTISSRLLHLATVTH